MLDTLQEAGHILVTKIDKVFILREPAIQVSIGLIVLNSNSPQSVPELLLRVPRALLFKHL